MNEACQLACLGLLMALAHAQETAFPSLAFEATADQAMAVRLPAHPGKDWKRVIFRPQRTNGFPEELEVLRTIQAPATGIVGLALAPDRVWVASGAARRIYRLDRANGAVLGSFPAPGPHPAGLHWDGKLLWHADARTNRVYALTAEGAVVRTFEVQFEPVALMRQAGELIVADWNQAVVHRLDAETGKELGLEPAPDEHLRGLTAAQGYWWCAAGNEIICFDRTRGLPICGFSAAPPFPAPCTVTGLTAAGGEFWLADAEGEVIRVLRIPQHGQWVAAGGGVRTNGFAMTYRNTAASACESFRVLQHVPFLEMPGQRYLSLEIHPVPQALFRDDVGNVIALLDFGRLEAGATVRCEIEARLWAADRRLIVDPARVAEAPLPAAYASYARSFHPIPGEDSRETRAFVEAAVGRETNAYWRVRLAHDALCRAIYYREPADESIPGVLRQGYGVCRNYSAALESFGRLLGLPVLNAWAPRHETCYWLLPGVGPTIMEVTANDSGPDPATPWRRSRWLLGTARGEITTGVRGYAMHTQVLLGETPFSYYWHYWLPDGLAGIEHRGWWTASDERTGAKRRL
jgi:hypothetical protein